MKNIKRINPSSPKFKQWADAYLNPNSETRGNSTRSALKHYNCKNYAVASVIGSENLRKLKKMNFMFDELEGRGVAYWLNISAQSAIEGGYDTIVDYMERLGYLATRPKSKKRAS